MKELLIPEKISLEKEWIRGIRKQDVKKLIALAVPGTVIGVIILAASGGSPMVRLFAIMGIIAYLFLCYVVVARVDGSQSILGYLELMIRFHREQQKFYYKHGKETLFYVATDRPEGADSAGIHQR